MEVLTIMAYKEEIKKFFSGQLYHWREGKSLTQEKSAESLLITVRAYGDLERGRYCPSTDVALLFLCLLEDDAILTIVHKLKNDVFLMNEGV